MGGRSLPWSSWDPCRVVQRPRALRFGGDAGLEAGTRSPEGQSCSSCLQMGGWGEGGQDAAHVIMKQAFLGPLLRGCSVRRHEQVQVGGGTRSVLQAWTRKGLYSAWHLGVHVWGGGSGMSQFPWELVSHGLDCPRPVLKSWAASGARC